MPDLRHTLAYRIVAGAARNALHGHPTWNVPASLVQSIAKRAAGTLMAHTAPAALAALRSEGKVARLAVRAPSGGGVATLHGAPVALSGDQVVLQKAIAALARRIAAAEKKGDQARYIDLCNAHRILRRDMAREQPGLEIR